MLFYRTSEFDELSTTIVLSEAQPMEIVFVINYTSLGSEMRKKTMVIINRIH